MLFTRVKFLLEFSFLSVAVITASGRSSQMRLDTMCGFQERLRQGCLISERVNAVSVLDCARLCSLYDECEGFGLGKDRTCYAFRHCHNVAAECAESDGMYAYYKRWPTENECLNGGSWSSSTWACDCYGGFVGLRCERYAISCRDLYDNRYAPQTRRRTLLRPPGYSAPFTTNCAILQSEIRTDLVHQTLGKGINNSRPWVDYVDGYYAPENNEPIRDLWLGLDKMHYLNQVYKLQTLIMAINFNNDKMVFFLSYFGVTIGGSDSNYKFTYEGVTFSTNSGSNITFHNCIRNGSSFSAPGADNDDDTDYDCSKNAGAGWWFSRCEPEANCNPLGVPYVTGTEEPTGTRMKFDGYDIRELATQFHHFRIYFSEQLIA